MNNYNTKNYFVHDKAIVDTINIGEKTRVWGFSHILENATIGKNCNICEHVFIENNVSIGDDVTVKCGVYIWDGITIEDNVFIGPCVTFINDRHPRSKQYPEKYIDTIVKIGASLGANSTIMCGITIGEWSTVGAGSMVLKKVNPYEIVVGNPAKVIGYNCICGNRLNFDDMKTSKCNCGLEYKINNELVERLQ